MKKIAFLTEVRNGAAYLPQAVESILCQTEPDFTYYLVDDGSTDATPELIRRYAAQDPRIVPLFGQPDMIGNFNAALDEICASDAACFALLDSDDWYEPNFAAAMMEQMERESADLAECTFIAHEEEDLLGQEDAVPSLGSGSVTLKEFGEDFSIYSFFDATQQWWGKLYRVALLRNHCLRADAGWDTTFVLRYRALCQRLAFLDRPLHHYRIRASSDCHKPLTSFDGRRAAHALTLQHDARAALLDAAHTTNPQSRLMAHYLDLNGLKSLMLRVSHSPIPRRVQAREIQRLLKLSFLPAAYIAVEQAYSETGRLFFAPHEASAQAMNELRQSLAYYLRLCGQCLNGIAKETEIWYTITKKEAIAAEK